MEGLPPGTPVYAFCTGGIRCVKVGAYLRQRHGLADVRRLKHGIIGYERWAQAAVDAATGSDAAAAAAAAPDAAASGATAAGSAGASSGIAAASLFRGTNFVFDERANALSAL